ncbi:histidine phosphatase family protein [Bremerella alba]|uniref:Phosphoserine phosphatase 1 n=1 Tax=Bremerella alba TaxID=980252 RepID=A0A7V8V7E5_9BACT|nr:histidine phosphatase family protein [Bremerella alba]MBA2116263.1 Phosphoserine phosphatase 1 [Bremerella alba]
MSDSLSEETCWMFLVRHGATDFNLKKPTVLQGNGINGPLAAIGREQASLTGKFLSSYAFDTVYASPMVRAMETAERIVPDQPIVPVPEIVEADVGRWLGRDWQDIQNAEPEAYRLHLEDPSIHPYPEGESATDVARRTVPALTKILQENLGKRVLVVAHNIVIRVMVAHLYQIPLKQMRTIRQDNCCVNLIRYQQEKGELVTCNSSFHLRALNQ